MPHALFADTDCMRIYTDEKASTTEPVQCESVTTYPWGRVSLPNVCRKTESGVKERCS